jgi:hypothetical protein
MKALLYVIGFGYFLLVMAYFILRPRALAQPESAATSVWRPLLVFSLILIGVSATMLYVGLFLMG